MCKNNEKFGYLMKYVGITLAIIIIPVALNYLPMPYDHYSEYYSDLSESVWLETTYLYAGIDKALDSKSFFKLHDVGPYEFSIQAYGNDNMEHFEKLIIHSVIIKDVLESKEFILQSPENNPVEVFFKQLHQPIAIYKSSKTFQPLFSEEQKLEAVIDISVKFRDKTKRKTFKFFYESGTYQAKGFFTLKTLIIGLMSG